MPKSARRKATALAYEPDLPAPIVVAKGKGRAALRMEALARDSGVPVVRDEPLAEGLSPLDIGDFVPEEYWSIVAHILVFIRKVES